MTAQQTMISKYGMPDGHYQSQWCILWEVKKDFPWFLVNKIFINRDFKDMLFKAFESIEAKGLQGEIKSFDGCLNQRPIRGSSAISMHSWAGAIDLNRVTGHMIEGLPVEKITVEMRRGPWSQDFIDSMKSAGIFFGGDFIHRPDPMHFSMLDM